MLHDLPLLRGAGKPSVHARRILVINGHPDPSPERFCAALCDAFVDGLGSSTHQIRRLLLGREEAEHDVERALNWLWWADRLFVAYPVWVGGPPPALKRLFEAFSQQASLEPANDGRLEAQVVVTASLPSLVYRAGIANRTHRSLLPNLEGVEIVTTTIIGSVDTISERDRVAWLAEMRRRGLNDNRG